ncbi:hypothetical protein CEXT_245691 [Caerostris extrusa]|uniref:Uncharacterized protein n=1 Tax=Caerostris extrusa TaxID=172846 RepID=A0AAV4N776_CAEEX|nr:hypothetical protein CEXT_245691 [Caerostris extrusa]
MITAGRKQQSRMMSTTAEILGRKSALESVEPSLMRFFVSPRENKIKRDRVNFPVMRWNQFYHFIVLDTLHPNLSEHPHCNELGLSLVFHCT